MENGDSINFDYNSPSSYWGIYFGSRYQQGLIALPAPTKSGEYYLIHINGVKDNPISINDSGTALLYSRIDMDEDNGLGAVVEKNQVVLTDTISATGLTATKHANGQDWWLLVFEANSKRLYRVLATPEGVFLEGTQLLDESIYYKITACAFSPDGSKFAIAQQKAEGVKHWLGCV